MNSADYSALDETLEVIAPMGPDLNNGLSNHAPMAVEAMCAMGRADAAPHWFEGYRHLLAPRLARVARLTNDNWRTALGDARRTEDWFEFFRNEIGERPWQSVLDDWAARLAPGLMAAATHGVIRTGHAVRALALQDTPARRRELADGLAYWAADYLPLPAERHRSARAMPSDAIARVQMIPSDIRRANGGAFTDALAQLETFEPFKRYPRRCRSGWRRARISFRSDCHLCARLSRQRPRHLHDYRVRPCRDRAVRPAPYPSLSAQYDCADGARLRMAGSGRDVRDLRHALGAFTRTYR